jgi:hypothetical protein
MHFVRQELTGQRILFLDSEDLEISPHTTTKILHDDSNSVFYLPPIADCWIYGLYRCGGFHLPLPFASSSSRAEDFLALPKIVRIPT